MRMLDLTLSFMGCKADRPEELVALAKKAIIEVENASAPKHILERQKLIFCDSCIESENGIILQGKAIKRLLSGCDEAFFLLATAGFSLDRLILAHQEISPSYALAVDAAASANVEYLCERVCADLAESGFALTPRFSPGYGDLPLSVSKDMIQKFNAKKRIGLYTNQAMLLQPSKSVTAIIGIRRTP